MPVDTSQLLPAAWSLGLALAIGLFIGLERGWREREVREGGRVAGLRTFALIGLAGGVLELLSPGSAVLLSAGLLCVALLFVVSFERAARASGGVSITTAVAALVTFALGALAVHGEPLLAMGAGVVVTLLLRMKDVLHGWLRRIEPGELGAVLQVAVLSAVILPWLPDQAMGPFGAINPFKAWLAVVLVSALSLAGHVAVRLRGQRQGLMWTGLLGGLTSSTAATLALSRVARERPALAPLAASAIVAACGVMFLRMAVIVAVLQPALAWRLAVLLVAPGLGCFLAAAWLWRHDADGPTRTGEGRRDVPLFGLSTALGFGAVLVVVAVASRGAQEALGTAGVYAVAFLSGLADVDAILFSSMQMHAHGHLALSSTAIALGLAVLANMVVKAAMAWTLAGRGAGRRVALGYGFSLGLGGLAAALIVLAR